MKNIHLHIETNFCKNRIHYVLDFLQDHPLAPPQLIFKIKETDYISSNDSITITYSKTKSSQNHYFIPAQEKVFSSTVLDSQTLFANAYQWKEQHLFSVETTQQSPQTFFQNKTFGFDILESIFFHLSRYEEHHASPKDWDKYDMLQESKHFLVRYQLYERPVLDHLVYCFFEALNLNPQKKATAFQLSHDIDSIWKLPSLYRLARAEVRLFLDKKPLLMGKLVQQYWKVKTQQIKDPFDVFDWFLNDNESVKKVMYLMAGGQTRYENFYSIHHPYVKDIIQKAKDLNYTIGLHPSYLTWNNPSMMVEELNTLERVVGHSIQHSRQHFLHCSFPDTFDILAQAGIKNDSTLGYQNLIGFRCGTGFDFYLYNFKTESPYPILETPMVVMDCALLTMTDYRVEQAESLLNDFLRQNSFYTQLTFNFHNHIFDELKVNKEKMRAIYQRLFF